MQNPLKGLVSRTEVPEDLKQKVQADIDLTRMTGNMGELFITHMGNTACKMLGLTSEKKENKM